MTQLGSKINDIGMRTARAFNDGSRDFNIYNVPGLSAYYDTTVLGSMTYTAATGLTSLVADLSGNSNANVLNFNGTAGCTVANIPAFGTGDFTVAAWITPQSLAANMVVFAGADQGAQIYILTTGKLLVNKRNVGDVSAQSTGTVTVGMRYLISYTRSGTTGTYYINGVASGTATDSYDYTGVVGFIGTINTGGGYITGNIQNVLIYNRALSAGEVATLYATGVPSAADTTTPAANTALVTGTDNTFAGAGNWVNWGGGTISIGAGVGSCTADSTPFVGKYPTTNLNTSNTLIVAGTRYRLTADIGSLSSGIVYLVDNFTGAVHGTIASASGTGKTVEFVAASSSRLAIATSVAGATFTLDNVTLVPLGLLLSPTLPLTRGATTIADTSGNAATITLPASGVWISGARDLAQVTGANQPIYLPWSGTNYGITFGGGLTSFSTPASAATRVFGAGSLEIQSYANPPSWTNSTGTYSPFWTNVLSDGQSGYELVIANASKRLLFRYTATGAYAGLKTATATADLPFMDGTPGYVKCTFNFSTGDVLFYSSTDGSAWTKIGATVTITAGTPFNGTDANRVGDYLAGGGPRNIIFYSELYNGIGGTKVASFKASDTTDGPTGGTWVSNTGETWTATTSSGGKPAMIVGKPAILFSGGVGGPFLQTAPFTLNQPTWIVLVGRQLTWSANKTFFDGNSQLSGALIQDIGSPQLTVYAGVALTGNGNLAIGATGIVTAVFNGASSISKVNNTVSVSGNAGAANMGGFTLGSRFDATQLPNILVNAVAIFNVAPTAAQIQYVVNGFAARFGVNLNVILLDSAGATIWDQIGDNLTTS